MRRESNGKFAPLRGKVTRVCKTKDVAKIIAMAREVKITFDNDIWPDNWPSWRNQLVDAIPFDKWQERNLVEQLFF